MNDDDRERLIRLEAGQEEIKATLSRLEPMIIKIMEGQARLEGRVSDMPSATEFGELRGRVEEISRRQGVTLAYTPPDQRRA